MEEKKAIPIEPPTKVHGCDCGGRTYILLYDGRIECRSCGNIPKTIRWNIGQYE